MSYNKLYNNKEEAVVALTEQIQKMGCKPGRKWVVLSWQPDDLDPDGEEMVLFFFKKPSEQDLKVLRINQQNMNDTQVQQEEGEKLMLSCVFDSDLEDFQKLYSEDVFFKAAVAKRFQTLTTSGEIDLKKSLKR